MLTSLACRRLRPALVDLAVGSLAPGDAHEVAAHVAACEPCRADLAAMRGLSVELRDPIDPLPPEDFWRRQRQSIMRRVRTVGAAPVTPVRRWKLAGALATVALSVFVARMHFERSAPGVRHAIESLDDDALFHLHDLLPALAPATTIDDADVDILAVHDLGDDEIDALADDPDS